MTSLRLALLLLLVTGAPPSTEPPAETVAEAPVPGPAPPREPPEPSESLAPQPAPAPGPSLGEVQRAAVARAQVDPPRARRWLRDARRSAALPDLDATWEHRMGQSWRRDREVGSPDGLVDDHDAADLWRLKLSWRLDRAWFNPDELRAARAAADLERLRRELLVEVTHLYFERERAARDWAAAPDAATRAESALVLAEIEGLLHAMTGLSWPPRPEF